MSWEQAVLLLRSQPCARDIVKACYYDDPLTEAARRYYSSPEWQSIRNLLPAPRSGAAALDIGSGRGISAFAFARDGWKTFALEPDPSPIVGAGAIRALSTDSGTPIEVHETWGEDLPFRDATFDVVHCRAALHHAKDLKALMCEIGRVLKPGGTFVGAREHVVSRHEDIARFQADHPLHRLYGGEYAYLIAEYRAAFRGAGLQLTRMLNPLGSNINTAPLTMTDVKRTWATSMGSARLARFIPDFLLAWRGALSSSPGRLYTFLAVKPY